ncbi:uracil-DNA glycosylase [Patescibacteria group bacterium]|nr:uracil-DNA glycosylase [Patescibacteria group bacterium]MBU1256481.1 uracil-DNA glycosylase [Patescibacteria group bacterium]MBU1457555.1 uracil-DNA glycosylase [Patescibacteria group bacterium]
MNVKIEPSWKKVLQPEFKKPYFKKLTDFVKKEYNSNTVYPPPKFIFNAFNSTPFNKVKVVILGQDPYHGPNQAHGLSFSVLPPTKPPPSLQNIYKEIKNDIGKTTNTSGDLTHWTKQGVLLLNATLTVRAHQAGSHQNQGWEELTNAIIQTLSNQKQGLIFMLWGNYAKQKGAVIDRQKHLILEAPHPSPFSAHSGFFGCQHFSQTNTYLLLNGQEPINW